MTDVLLFLIGCCCGALVNWAVYRWAIIHPRAISPWSRLGQADFRTADCVPVIGWWLQRRLAPTFGAGFWMRPMLIELGCGLALPLLRNGIANGMLTSSSQFSPLLPDASQLWVWLGFFYLLYLLLAVATFIDFDEKTIPDIVTLPGTMIALIVAYFVAASRLPDVDILNRGALQIQSLQFASPRDIPTWHRGPWGLAAVLCVNAVWMFGLLPKYVSWRWGIARGFQYMVASILRPPRTARAGANVACRTPLPQTRWIGALWVIISGVSMAAWYCNGESWDRLFGAEMGLAFGGGLVWAVRIVAGGSLGREAMGFGDVTLMGMIGAWLGWQPALLVFAIAPFAALLIAVVQLLTLRRTEIAFGPYLSMGAVIVVVFWGSLWHDWAKYGVFILGPIVLIITAICLVLMAAMLGGWRMLRDRWSGESK